MKTATPTTTFHKKGDNNMSHTSPIVSWRRLTGLAGAAAVIVALVTSAAPAVAATKAAAFSKPRVTLSPASATGLDDVSFNLLPGAANDIAVGPNGDVWVIGSDNNIYEWNGSTWVQKPGRAVDIAVGPNGPWVVNAAHQILYWNGNGFTQVPGAAIDIGSAPGGYVWVIGTDNGIYEWNGYTRTWVQTPGRAVNIAVGENGPWVVNAAHQIFYWHGTGFTQVPGAANDIGISPGGDVWVIGTDNGIYRWNGTNNWVQEPGAAVDVAVGPNGPWVVNAAHQIYHSIGSGARVSLSAVPASTGSSTTVTAYANADVGPTPYYIEIFDETGARLTSCGTGSSCSYTYTPSLNALVAFVSDSSASLPPGQIQATSNVLYVAHH